MSLKGAADARITFGVNMGLLNRFRKTHMSYEDSARLLLSAAMANIDSFLNEDLLDISDYLSIDLDDFDKDILRSEIMLLCLWTATKALEPDKQRLIEMVHNAFFDVFKDKKHEELRRVFSQRSDKYDEAWDETSGSNQSILSVAILASLLCDGEPNEDLLDIRPMSVVQAFVFNTMENVLNARKNIRLTQAKFDKRDTEKPTPEQLALLFLNTILERLKKTETDSNLNGYDTQRLIGELSCLLMFAVHLAIYDYFNEETEGAEIHEAFLNHRVRSAEHKTDITEAQHVIDTQDQRISHYSEVAQGADPNRWQEAIGKEFAKLCGYERNLIISMTGPVELIGMMKAVQDMLHSHSYSR